MIYNVRHNNVFPMRKEIIPKHIKLDTTTLVHLLIDNSNAKHGTKSKYLFKGNLKRYEDNIWKFFFRTERQCFRKKNYSFHHMIETDGVSCSILLLRNDLIGKRIRMKKIPNRELYIDEIKDYTALKNKKIVGIDPNMADLLYCVDGDTKQRNHYRYTQNQRRKETKLKKYSKIILQYKKECKTKIIELETELSKYNRKTLQIDKFKEYIKKKNQVNNLLFDFYEKYIFRKLKLNSYLNILKSEQKLINRFIKIFGTPNETIIAIGDFEQKKHRKYKEPIKGKGFRNMFRKNGFNVYLVDEFRTSCRCSNCCCDSGECRKFKICRNPKPMKNNSILCHGVLMCKTCGALWNRDENSSRNIYKIAKKIITNGERPNYLKRQNSYNAKKSISDATSVGKLNCPLVFEKIQKSHNHNLHNSETSKP